VRTGTGCMLACGGALAAVALSGRFPARRTVHVWVLRFVLRAVAFRRPCASGRTSTMSCSLRSRGSRSVGSCRSGHVAEGLPVFRARAGPVMRLRWLARAARRCRGRLARCESAWGGGEGRG